MSAALRLLLLFLNDLISSLQSGLKCFEVEYLGFQDFIQDSIFKMRWNSLKKLLRQLFRLWNIYPLNVCYVELPLSVLRSFGTLDCFALIVISGDNRIVLRRLTELILVV